MSYRQFQSSVIDSALRVIGLYSDVASELILATGVQETGLSIYAGINLYNYPDHKHLGLWKSYINHHPKLAEKLLKITSKSFDVNSQDSRESELLFNLKYCSAICRIHYYSKSPSLPQSTKDIIKLAEIWGTYYNTTGSWRDFLSNYHLFINSQKVGI